MTWNGSSDRTVRLIDPEEIPFFVMMLLLLKMGRLPRNARRLAKDLHHLAQTEAKENPWMIKGMSTGALQIRLQHTFNLEHERLQHPFLASHPDPTNYDTTFLCSKGRLRNSYLKTLRLLQKKAGQLPKAIPVLAKELFAIASTMGDWFSNFLSVSDIERLLNDSRELLEPR